MVDFDGSGQHTPLEPRSAPPVPEPRVVATQCGVCDRLLDPDFFEQRGPCKYCTALAKWKKWNAELGPRLQSYNTRWDVHAARGDNYNQRHLNWKAQYDGQVQGPGNQWETRRQTFERSRDEFTRRWPPGTSINIDSYEYQEYQRQLASLENELRAVNAEYERLKRLSDDFRRSRTDLDREYSDLENEKQGLLREKGGLEREVREIDELLETVNALSKQGNPRRPS